MYLFAGTWRRSTDDECSIAWIPRGIGAVSHRARVARVVQINQETPCAAYCHLIFGGMTIATALGWQQSGSSWQASLLQEAASTDAASIFSRGWVQSWSGNLMWSAGNVVGFAVVKIQMIFSEVSHLPTSPYRITRRCVRQTFSGR